MRVAGCFLEYDGKFVILLRQAHKPDGSTWGLPGGKVEAGETDGGTVLRELEEETGYQAVTAELEHLGNYDFVSTRGEPFTYATYRVKLSEPQQIRIESSAHADYHWVTAEECDARHDLIAGFHELLRLTGYVKASS